MKFTQDVQGWGQEVALGKPEGTADNQRSDQEAQPGLRSSESVKEEKGCKAYRRRKVAEHMDSKSTH